MTGLENLYQQTVKLLLARKLPKTEKFAKLLLEDARTANDPEHECKANDLLGEVCRVTGNYKSDIDLSEQAIDYFKKAAALAERHKLTLLKPQVLIHLGTAYLDLKRFDNAREQFVEALQISQQHTDIRGQNYAYTALSQFYVIKNDFEKAMEYTTKCYEVTKETKEDDLWLNYYIRLGFIYVRRHQYSEILEYFEKALTLSKKIGDVEAECLAMANIAVAYASKSEFKLALQHFLSSLEKSEQIQFNLNNIKCLVNIGTIFSILHNHEEAQKRYNDVLTSYGDTLDANTSTVMHYNIGDGYFSMKKWEEAEVSFSTCLEIAEQVEYKEVIALALAQKGRTSSAQKKYDEALEFGFRAEKLFDELGDIHGRQINLVSLGRIYFETDQLETALDYANRGFETANTMNSQEVIADALVLLSSIFKKKEDYKRAYEYHVRYAEFMQKLDADRLDRHLVDMEIMHEIRDKQKKIELLEKTRAQQESEFQEKITQLKMQALQAQMNPHFIFNSMNAIQQFLTTNDSESAMIYLSRFARLIRLIFEYSRKSSVTLEEEIDFLKLYLDLENLRFKNKVTVNLEIEDGIDKESISIPPLLVQPLIENAFKHGLMHKESDGKLLIFFSQNNGWLKCTVQDNGVGRKKAKELGQWKPENYRSSGLKITKERLKLMKDSQNENDENIRLSIEDLHDGNGQPAGTKVELLIDL